ncbi:MAG: carbohydrate kinase family protein [Chloroflexi bacterium]|nr:carbohydrate kinase family protein [Chloroflexota bacterium]
MDTFHLIRYVIAGILKRDFIVTAQEKSYFDIPGGSLLYTAAGLSLWDSGLGMVGSVGEDFPQEWFDRFNQAGFDIRGLSILPESIDLRSFIFYLDNKRYQSLNPISQFAQMGIAIPRALLGFIPASQRQKTDHQGSSAPISINQIPADYLDATAAHICALESKSQSTLIAHLQGHVNNISLNADASYMKASGWDVLPGLLSNIKIFHTSEENLINLFKGRTTNVWEMIEGLSGYGLELIIVKRGKDGQFLYDCLSRKRWSLPAYPVTSVDATGCGDAFCGGFMAGYQNSYDPLEAALHGNIAASFCLEGVGAFYLTGVLPGLANARLRKLKEMVKRL